MIPHDKASSIDLAVAFLRKGAGRTRITLWPREVVETEDAWIFDFYYQSWQGLRKRHEPYGVRVSVEKRTGRAKHYASLRSKKIPTNQMNNRSPCGEGLVPGAFIVATPFVLFFGSASAVSKLSFYWFCLLLAASFSGLLWAVIFVAQWHRRRSERGPKRPGRNPT